MGRKITEIFRNYIFRNYNVQHVTHQRERERPGEIGETVLPRLSGWINGEQKPETGMPLTGNGERFGLVTQCYP
jgi:hypothetical protein